MKVYLPQYRVSASQAGIHAHFTDPARHAEWATPTPPHAPHAPRSGSTHTSLAGSARPSTTRTFRELILAMAPNPKLSGREGARVPRLDRGEGGWQRKESTCHQLQAWRPGPGSQRLLSETRGAGREVFEGGERIGVPRGRHR